MGLSCSREEQATDVLDAVPDPDMYAFWKRSVELVDSAPRASAGSAHLLYKNQSGGSVVHRNNSNSNSSTLASFLGTTNNSAVTKSGGSDENKENDNHYPTRLLIRRHQVRSCEEGVSGTHIYACRWPVDQEQCPTNINIHQESAPASPAANLIISEPPPPKPSSAAKRASNKSTTPSTTENISSASPPSVDHLFAASTMAAPPARKGTYG